MERSITDAAILQGRLIGIDHSDPATPRSDGKLTEDYSVYLDSNGLSGSIIGVSSNDTKDFYEFEEYDQELFEGVIHTLRDKGTIVKEVDIPSYHRDWNYGVMLYEYLYAKLEDLYFSQEQGGIDFTLKKYNLDAILFPSYIGSTICAKAGYPSIAVPAFEQATKHRKSPILKK